MSVWQLLQNETDRLLLHDFFFSVIERFSSNNCVLHKITLLSWVLGWRLTSVSSQGHYSASCVLSPSEQVLLPPVTPQLVPSAPGPLRCWDEHHSLSPALGRVPGTLGGHFSFSQPNDKAPPFLCFWILFWGGGMEMVTSWDVVEIPVHLTGWGSSLELLNCVIITKNVQHPELLYGQTVNRHIC